MELMPSISIHELRHVTPRYHDQINEPDVSLKYPDLAYLRLSPTERSICRKNKRPPVASASPPQNYASSSAAGQTFANHCHRKPNGSTKSATNAYAIKSKNSKHKPIEHASVSRLTFVPSLITWDDSDIITIIGIELNGSRS
jgi:hypothetical protein